MICKSPDRGTVGSGTPRGNLHLNEIAPDLDLMTTERTGRGCVINGHRGAVEREEACRTAVSAA